MTQTPAEDPVFSALDPLVRSGELTTDQAQAAFDAARGRTGLLSGAIKLETLAVAFGVALLGTTVILSTGYSRADGDLDWSNYGLGLAATAALLAVAGLAWARVRDTARRDNLVAWPGAVGAVGAGLMLGVAMDDTDGTAYVVGLVILALSAGGYFLVRQSPFLLSGLVGLFVLYAQAFDDLFDVADIEGDNIGMMLGSAIFLFALVVTGASWFLPRGRDVSTLVVGAAAAYGFGLVLLGLAIVRVLQGVFAGFSASFDEDPSASDGPDLDVYDNDVYVIVLFALVMVAVWALCWWISGHEGYRLLIAYTIASVIPAAILALAVESPSYWGLATGLMGGVVLAWVGLRAVGVISSGPADSDA